MILNSLLNLSPPFELLPDAGGGGGGSGDCPTVDAITAGLLAALTGTTITINSPVDVSNGSRLYLIQGDDHTEGDRLPSWTITGYTGPDLTDCTAVLRLLQQTKYARKTSNPDADLEVEATIEQVDTTLTITAPITADESATLSFVTTATDGSTHRYQILATTAAGKKHSIKFGPVVVTREIEAPAA